MQIFFLIILSKKILGHTDKEESKMDEIKNKCSYRKKTLNEYFVSVSNKDDASGHKGTGVIANGCKIYKNGNFSIQGESKNETALMH